MRLGIKLAALAFVLLLPKTSLYVADTGVSETQLAPEPRAAGRVVELHDLSQCVTVSAYRNQAEVAACAAADTARGPVLVHLMDKRATGS